MPNLVLLGAGLVFFTAAALVWVLTYLDPLPARQRHRMIRMARYRVRHSGLRGRYDFSKPGPNGEPGIYRPADEADLALFLAVRVSIESDASHFSAQTLWSDLRLVWGGVGLALIGAALTVFSTIVLTTP